MIENLGFEYMCMSTSVKSKSKTLAPYYPTISQVSIIKEIRLASDHIGIDQWIIQIITNETMKTDEKRVG